LVAFQAIRQELSPETQKKYLLSVLLPKWSFWAWVASALFVSLLIVLETSYREIWKLQQQHNAGAVSFFEDRNELNATTGGVLAELERCREGVAIWPGGGTTTAFPSTTFAHISRLILLDPNNAEAVNEYSDLFLINKQTARAIILDVTARALAANVKVRWSSHCYIGILVNDPNGSSATSRVEILLPGIEAAFRPNFILSKRDSPALFANLMKMYENTWNQSKDAKLD
jgi:hypothetical protein